MNIYSEHSKVSYIVVRECLILNEHSESLVHNIVGLDGAGSILNYYSKYLNSLFHFIN